MRMLRLVILLSLSIATFVAVAEAGAGHSHGQCQCDRDEHEHEHEHEHESRGLKIGAIFAILACSALGVIIPLVGKSIAFLKPGTSTFYLIKAFAAGVILSTGMVHIFPEAQERLVSPCLAEVPWHTFHWAGFVALLGAIATLMVDCFATSFFSGSLSKKDVSEEPNKDDAGGDNDNVLSLHQVHYHAHGPPVEGDNLSAKDLVRYRVIAQVLELGIIFHSVIIGIALGVSDDSDVIKPLFVVLCFHQFFEGLGLGGCIAQAKFKVMSMITMALFFSLTTPLGVAIGIIVSSSYDENSSTGLIVQGLLDALAAGILIYTALVDLLAADFMSPKVQSSGRLQLGVNFFLLLGVGVMAILAKWA